MGLIKDNGYSAEDKRMTAIGKAVGHPARKLIIEMIVDGEYLRNIDLPDRLNLSLTSVHRHLTTLYSVGLLRPIYHLHYSEIVFVEETWLEYTAYVNSIAARVGGRHGDRKN